MYWVLTPFAVGESTNVSTPSAPANSPVPWSTGCKQAPQ